MTRDQSTTGEAQTHKLYSGIELLANNPNYTISDGFIRPVTGGSANRLVDLAVVGKDRIPVITYSPARGLLVALGQSNLAGYLMRFGIQTREQMTGSNVPDIYAGFGSQLLALAHRLRPEQDRMVSEELQRGQQG